MTVDCSGHLMEGPLEKVEWHKAEQEGQNLEEQRMEMVQHDAGAGAAAAGCSGSSFQC